MKFFEDIKSHAGAISSSMYVAVQLLANVLSTKIALLPILNWPIDGGTIIYPLAFTLRDFVHKTMGKSGARQIIVLAALTNVVMVLLFMVVGKMQPDPTWPNQGAYDAILMPVFRITLASIVAQVVSEFVDTEIFSFIYRSKRWSDVLASLGSNLVALVVDSVVFSFIAFAGSMPIEVVGQIIVTNILIKLVMSIFASPTIALVPRQVEFDKI
ncbi:MAG: queuosine precursor transporter [bacterium]|nr:queuosine precursor transporter [bacterium]